MNRGKRFKRDMTISQIIMLCSVILFAVLLLLIIAVNYKVHKNLVYDRYEHEMEQVLRYVKSNIDVDDLKECWDTGQKSETYNELQDFMDDFVDNYDVHYLYIGYPVITDDGKAFYSLCSANSTQDKAMGEDYCIYMGDDAGESYSRQLIQLLVAAMNQDDVVFFDDYTAWGEDYSACCPLVSSSGEHFAILCVDERISEINDVMMKNVIVTSLIILVIGIAFSVLLNYILNLYLSNPLLSIINSVSQTNFKNAESRKQLIKELEEDNTGGREIQKLRETILVFIRESYHTKE